MKTIGYKERAEFYSNEIIEDEKEHSFLTKLITKCKIKSVLEIPCGCGFNLELFSQSCEKVTMLDKEEAMVKQVQKRIKKMNISNCSTMVADIMNYQLDIKPELTYIPHEALQLFSKEEVKAIINNIMLNTEKYVLFDIFNYFGTGEDGIRPSYLLEGTTYFEYLGIKYTRDGKIERNAGSLDLIFHYKALGSQYTTSITLYQYSVEDIVWLFSEQEFNFIKVFCDYDFNLWKGEKRAFFLVCK